MIHAGSAYAEMNLRIHVYLPLTRKAPNGYLWPTGDGGRPPTSQPPEPDVNPSNNEVITSMHARAPDARPPTSQPPEPDPDPSSDEVITSMRARAPDTRRSTGPLPSPPPQREQGVQRPPAHREPARPWPDTVPTELPLVHADLPCHPGTASLL